MQTNELIITIRETAGSGAEKIGKLIADQLGVPCYGKEILDKASEISGIERRIFDKYDELPVFAGLDLTAPNEDTIELPDTNTLANAQMAAVKALAVKSCVLVGRYSALALAEHRNACHFVLDDEFEARRKRLETDVGHPISIFKLRKTDKLRKLYYRSEEHWASEAGKQVLITRQGRSDRQLADLILKQLTKVEKGA